MTLDIAQLAMGLLLVVLALMVIGANWIRPMLDPGPYDVDETPTVAKPAEPTPRPAVDDGYRHAKCPHCNGKIG